MSKLWQKQNKTKNNTYGKLEMLRQQNQFYKLNKATDNL